MSQPDELKGYTNMQNLTRREALQKGGIVIGGLTVAGVAVSENVAAGHGATGGNMLSLSDPILRTPFTAEASFEFEFPASCFASESALKGFQELVITYASGVQALAAVRTNKTHLAADGETTYAFTSSQQCRDSASPTGADIWKAAFKPA